MSLLLLLHVDDSSKSDRQGSGHHVFEKKNAREQEEEEHPDMLLMMMMSVLDGGQRGHRHPTEKEAGSSEEVTLVAQVIPAVQPGLEDGGVRRKTYGQATVVDGHEVSYQHERIC